MKLVLVSACLVLGVGCAGAQTKADAAAPPSNAQLLAGPFSEDAWVDGHHVTGGTAALALGDSTLVGRFRGASVHLDWSARELRGLIGERRVKLELAEGDDVYFQGLFAGRPAQLTLDTRGLRGRVGACAFDLQRADGGFVGVRDCGSGPEPTEVAFPAPLEQRPLGARAALLGLVLASDGKSAAAVAGAGNMKRERPSRTCGNKDLQF